MNNDKILTFQSEINILIDKYINNPTEPETKLLSKIIFFYEKYKHIDLLIKNDDGIDSDNENDNNTLNNKKFNLSYSIPVSDITIVDNCDCQDYDEPSIA